MDKVSVVWFAGDGVCCWVFCLGFFLSSSGLNCSSEVLFLVTCSEVLTSNFTFACLSFQGTLIAY